MRLTPRFLIICFFNFLIFSVPLYFRFENEELFEFNKMILVYALTVCISFLWVLRMIFEKKLIFRPTPLDIPITLFVFSQLLSTIFSIHPHTSWLGYYSRFNGGLLSTLSYVVLFYAFVSNFKKKEIGGFFMSAFISGLIVSVYGIMEHFGHSISCLLLPSNRTFGVDCWVQKVQDRVFATFGQPNWLAAYVIALIPVAFVAAIQKKLPLLKRGVFIVTVLALFLVLLYTKSRSGILGLAVGFLVFGAGSVLIYSKHKSELLKKTSVAALGLLFASMVSMAVLNGTEFTPSLTKIISSTKNKIETGNTDQTEAIQVNRLDIGGTDSGEIRKIVWTGAFKVWQRYPIIGSGVETFAYSYYKDRIREHNDVSEWDFLYNKAHNELLNLMATSGIIGLITYLSIFAVLTVVVFKICISKKYTVTEKLIALSLFSGQIALFVSNFFGFSTVGVNVLMYLAFAIICVIYINEKDQEKYVMGEGSQYFSVTLAGIVCLVLLFRVYNYWAADHAYAQGKNYFESGEYQLGVEKLLESIDRSPNEATYYEALSDNYAKLVSHFASLGEATVAAQIASEAVIASNQTMQLNDRHLNFYKTRAKVMVTLSQIDEAYLEEAKITLLRAIELSPTDPKLVFTLAVIEQTNNNLETALALYQKATQLKPNYERAYWKISEIYEAQGKIEQAIESLKQLLIFYPNNKEASEKIKLLEKL